jgi:Flp pilus assembly pilin Flp
MRNLVKRRLRSKRGQSILEYLVITTVVVLAILAIRGVVTTRSNDLFTQAGDKIGEATTALGTYAVQAR